MRTEVKGLTIDGDGAVHAVTCVRTSPRSIYVEPPVTHCSINLEALVLIRVVMISKQDPDCPLCILAGRPGGKRGAGVTIDIGRVPARA